MEENKNGKKKRMNDFCCGESEGGERMRECYFISRRDDPDLFSLHLSYNFFSTDNKISRAMSNISSTYTEGRGEIPRANIVGNSFAMQ